MDFVVKNNDFSQFDEDKHLHLVKIDRNNTHYYVDSRCPKCGGTGFLHEYAYIDGGVCYKCLGTGNGHRTITVRTEEYRNKMEERRHKKLKKEAPAFNKAQLNKMGFSDDGVMWLVMGDTYSIKDTLKAAGAHYSQLFGWHFDREPEIEVPTVRVSAYLPYETDLVDEYQAICTLDEDDRIVWAGDLLIYTILTHIRYKYIEDTSVETYFGEVGAKFDVNTVLSKRAWYDNEYGRTYVYSFTDNDNHVFVWKTQKCLDIEIDDAVSLCGTIKAHKTFRGVKQTEVTRCKVKAANPIL